MKIQNILKKENTFFLLVSILPISFVLGPLITEIICLVLIIFFLKKSILLKDFFFLKNKIFIYFCIFYLYLIFGFIFSEYKSETAINLFFYIRFILFAFSLSFFLNYYQKNLIKIFIIFSLSISVVIFDGYWQFFFEKNLLGVEKFRPDRISGLFGDDLILGSYISRLLPLLIALTIYFKHNTKVFCFNLVIIFFSFFLIFLSGERAAFFNTLIVIFLIILLINLKLKYKISFFIIFLTTLFFLVFYNPTIYDRYFKQTKSQLFNSDSGYLTYYYPFIKTSIKMFNDNKLIGQGIKTYRYHCNDKRFVNYFSNPDIVDNTIIKYESSWKIRDYIKILNFYVKEGDIIKKGDKLFDYSFIKNKKKIQNYFSDKEGKILIINDKQDRYQSDEKIFDIEPLNSPKEVLVKRDGCTTHPHNFYLQLLAETGLIGFLFIFFIFLILGIILLKNFIYIFRADNNRLSDPEICLIVGFFVILWPFTTNGNFFNNWINLISFYPLGFFLYLQNKKKNDF